MIPGSITSKIIINVFLILITILTGGALHKSGKPYPPSYFAVHKILTITFVVFLSIIVVRFTKEYHFEGHLQLFLISGIASVLLLIVSGGMISIGKMQMPMFQVHRYAVILFLISLSGTLYAILKEINLLP